MSRWCVAPRHCSKCVHGKADGACCHALACVGVHGRASVRMGVNRRAPFVVLRRAVRCTALQRIARALTARAFAVQRVARALPSPRPWRASCYPVVAIAVHHNVRIALPCGGVQISGR